MVSLNAYSVSIGGRAYNANKSLYPVRPSIYSGVDVSFGASSCFDHPDPTTATLSLWVPKTHESHLPTLGERVKVRAAFDQGNSVSVFDGIVDKVMLADDHQTAGTYDTAYDGTVLYTGSAHTPDKFSIRYRNLSDSTLLTVPTENIIVAADGTVTVVMPMDVQYQHTGKVNMYVSLTSQTLVNVPANAALTFETVVTGADGYITANFTAADLTSAGSQRNYDGTLTQRSGAGIRYLSFGDASLDVRKGVEAFTFKLTVRNIAAIPAMPQQVPGYRVNIQCSDATAQAGRLRIGDEPWDSTALMARLSRIAELASPSGVEFFDPGYYKVVSDNTYSTPATLGGDAMLGVTVRARDVDAVNALEVYQDTAMSAGVTVGSVDNRVTPNYKLLLPQVLSKDVNGAYVSEQTSEITQRPIPVIPVGAIRDDTYTLDTTESVNQIKISYFVRQGTAWSSEFLAVKDTSMVLDSGEATLKIPVTRSVKAENQVNDPYSSIQPPSVEQANGLVVKANAALSAQSYPRWRFSGSLSIVLKELPYMSGLVDLIEEAGRFGQLVRIDGVPGRFEKYQRIRSGRIVLGENPSMEFEVEPVDFSGPIALTRDTLYYDATANAVTIGDMTTLSSDDLRSVGAR